MSLAFYLVDRPSICNFWWMMAIYSPLHSRAAIPVDDRVRLPVEVDIIDAAAADHPVVILRSGPSSHRS